MLIDRKGLTIKNGKYIIIDPQQKDRRSINKLICKCASLNKSCQAKTAKVSLADITACRSDILFARGCERKKSFGKRLARI